MSPAAVFFHASCKVHEPLHCHKILAAYVITDVVAAFQQVRYRRGHPHSTITHGLRL